MYKNKIIYQDNKILKFLIESPKYGNKEIIIDTEDWDKINKYKWCIRYNKITDKFYVLSNSYSKMVQLHRLIMNVCSPEIKIDHESGDTFDNRKYNLRRCTSSQNSHNYRKPKNNKSGYKGVAWHKNHSKWQAIIQINKKQIHLGYFTDKIKAALAYNKAAIKYHGEFARLNNIEEYNV